MDQRLNLVILVVSDLAASRRFYVDGLGWSTSLEAPDEVVMIRVGDKVVLSLWSEAHAINEVGPMNSGGTPPVILAYNTTSPAEVDEVLATAQAAGAQVKPAVKRDWGGYTGYFTDPDGFSWEVAHNPHPIGDVTLP